MSWGSWPLYAGLICGAILGNVQEDALSQTDVPVAAKEHGAVLQTRASYEKSPGFNSSPLISQPAHQLSRTEPLHRPIELIDRVVAGSDFAQFRDRLQRAIRNRDIGFIQSILPPEGVQLGVAPPLSLVELNLDQADGWFWKLLEKMMRLDSCELEDHPGSIPDAAIWACPNIANTFYRQNPHLLPMLNGETAASPVVVIGRGVNVRTQPRIGAAIIGVLYNEVVTFDQTAWNRQERQRQRTLSDPMTGWTPVILPNQAHGYVYNRYAYKLLDPRGLFEHVNGEWRLFHIVMGE